MRSTAALRAVALVCIPTLINPVAADGLIHLDPSCDGDYYWWAREMFTRSIAVASRMHYQLLEDPQAQSGLRLFLDNNLEDGLLFFDRLKGYSLASGDASLRGAQTGDYLVSCAGSARFQELRVKDEFFHREREQISRASRRTFFDGYYPGTLPDCTDRHTDTSVNMMYHWAPGLPDKLELCPWWLQANIDRERLPKDSIAAYVLPAIEGSLQDDRNGRLKRWKFSQWKTWWDAKRRVIVDPDLVDMDVYQPSDLLFIAALSHTQKVGHIGVSPDETGTSSDNFDTYTWSAANFLSRAPQSINYVYVAKVAFAAYEGFAISDAGAFTGLTVTPFPLLKNKRFPDLGSPTRYYVAPFGSRFDFGEFDLG